MPGLSSWLDVDWSAHARWVEVAGAPVNVVELAPPGVEDPEAIVFIHGHSGSWQNWLEQLPVLARRFRVIAMDLPGFGQSPMPREPVTISGYAKIVEELLDRLDVSAAAVVGNSMGGFVGAELAICFPPRVERLVLVSAAGLATRYIGFPLKVMDRFGEPVLTRVGPLLAPVEERARAMAARPGLRRAGFLLLSPHPERLDPRLFYENVMASGRKPAAGIAAAEIARYDFRDRLQEIACPTLVVWGDRDRVVPPSSADEFERLIPDARKVVFDDCGHVPMMEAPERFNLLLEDFLDEAPNEQVDETSEAA
ncbi:MAG TPA: alpha/beta hydrolase [Capillimicrobium sp.]|jgi:pimeloyl-ACP methyl ester carboxylesterase